MHGEDDREKTTASRLSASATGRSPWGSLSANVACKNNKARQETGFVV
jgi:hypothetical protein